MYGLAKNSAASSKKKRNMGKDAGRLPAYIHTYIHTFLFCIPNTYIHTYIYSIIAYYIHTYIYILMISFFLANNETAGGDRDAQK